MKNVLELLEKIRIVLKLSHEDLNNHSLSKGKRVVNAQQHNADIKQITVAIEDIFKSNDLESYVDGSINIRMVTSNNRICYFVKELNASFAINQISRPMTDKPDLTEVQFDVIIPGKDTIEGFKTLDAALLKALTVTGEYNDIVKDYLKNDSRSTLLAKVREELGIKIPDENKVKLSLY